MYPILLQYVIFLLLWFSSSFNFLKYFSFPFPPCIVLLRFSRASSISVHSQACHISTLAPVRVPSLFHSSYLLLPPAKRSLSTFLCWKLRLLLLFWTGCSKSHLSCPCPVAVITTALVELPVLAPTAVPSLSTRPPEGALKWLYFIFLNTLPQNPVYLLRVATSGLVTMMVLRPR